MAKKQKQENTTDELLRDILIVQLGLAGLTQSQIREIVGGDMNRVNYICKRLCIPKVMVVNMLKGIQK